MKITFYWIYKDFHYQIKNLRSVIYLGILVKVMLNKGFGYFILYFFTFFVFQPNRI